MLNRHLGAQPMVLDSTPRRGNERVKLRFGLDRRILWLQKPLQLPDALLCFTQLRLRRRAQRLRCCDLVVILPPVVGATEGDKRQERDSGYCT